MAIRVLSFDFDGCLFNLNYVSSLEKDVVKSNEAFLNKVKKENQGFTKAYTFVGSNRQSLTIDVANSYGKGSCFPAVKTVSDFLGTSLDPFLLADIYGDLPDGTSYARATNKGYTGNHSYWLFDETKATILYAQMHKIANVNPNEEIIFDFYDDRGNQARSSYDILEQLSEFYGKNRDLIPANVTLCLHQYAGTDVTLIAQIKGTGFIDVNYRQTVKDLAAQAVTSDNDGIYKQIYVTEHAKSERLNNRKPLEKTTASGSRSIKDDLTFDVDHAKQSITLSKEAQAAEVKFTAALREITKKAKELDKEGDKLYNALLPLNEQSKSYRSYKNAAEAAIALHDSLLKIDYKDHDKEALKKAIESATKIALDSELKNHRGYLKQILGYTAIAVLAVLSVATLGGFYLLAGGVNYAINRQFFFSTTINTDSVNKVLDLKEAADELSAAP